MWSLFIEDSLDLIFFHVNKFVLINYNEKVSRKYFRNFKQKFQIYPSLFNLNDNHTIQTFQTFTLSCVCVCVCVCVSYSSAEKQSVYSTAPADWATRTLVREDLMQKSPQCILQLPTYGARCCVYKYRNIYIYIYIYTYCHPHTDCFVLSQLFSVVSHAGRLKLGSKLAQLYVRLSIRPLSQQAYHVDLGNYMVLCSNSISSIRLFTFYTIPDTRVLNSFEELCIMRAAYIMIQMNFDTKPLKLKQ